MFLIKIQLILISDQNIFQGNADLSQINYPAITICSQSSSKYAIAERLSNFMDPSKELPPAFRTIRNEFLICATGIYAYMKKWTTSLQSSNTCLNTDNPAEGCKVYFLTVKIIKS